MPIKPENFSIEEFKTTVAAVAVVILKVMESDEAPELETLKSEVSEAVDRHLRATGKYGEFVEEDADAADEFVLHIKTTALKAIVACISTGKASPRTALTHIIETYGS